MTIAKVPYLWLTAGQYLWKPRSESKDRHPSAQAHGGCRMRALTAHIGSYSAAQCVPLSTPRTSDTWFIR